MYYILNSWTKYAVTVPALIKRKSVGYVYIKNVIARFNVVEKASKAENLCVLKVEYCEKYLGQKELSS